MIQKKLLLFSLIFISTLFFSQKNITGKITNEKGDAVPSASVTIEEPGKDAIIAYAITNSKGEFKISFTSDEPEVEVKVKAYNHKPNIQKVKNQSQTLNFNLESTVTEIKEVILKTKLITKKGDTITYDLNSFDTKNDRTLADVLKRMPGMEVNKDGSILYQGQPLSKFYVNGKDLMEGGYGVINNSLPKDAVSKVEVLENHQPIKILQDKVPSDQPAINIKLKKKITMTGRGEVGLGFMDPALWNIKLTPMFFGQKNQWVVNYKTNNMGESVENEGRLFAMGNRWEGRRSNADQNNWLGTETASIPSLPEKRYLFNNVHFLSSNILTNPFKSKEWELKANASYTNNDVERESYNRTIFVRENKTVETNIINHFYTNKAKAELNFTKNAKKGFFKNTTTFSQFWNGNTAEVQRKTNGSLQHSVQNLNSPTSSFQNSLSTIVPWKEKLINIISYVSYQNDRQTLDISPANYVVLLPSLAGDNSIIQNFSMKSLELNHSANVSFTKKFWTFTPEIGLNYTKNYINSELSGDIQNLSHLFQNDLDFNNTIPFAQMRVNYKKDAWSLFANIPVNFNNIKATDPERGLNKNYSKATFEPSIFTQYEFASFWKASVRGSLSYFFGNEQNMYAGYLMTTPESISNMDINNPIPENFNKSAGARLEYRNPLNNLFFNLGYSVNNTTKNLISSFQIINGFSSILFEALENENNSNTARAEIGKYFPKFKTNISTSFSNSINNSFGKQNNEFAENRTTSNIIGFKFNNSYFSWINVDYSFTHSQSLQKTSLSNRASVSSKNYNHNLSAFIYPADNHTIGFYWDQINNSVETEKYKNAFFDLSYQFSWDKKKVDFELKWMNIANTKFFERASVNTFTDSFSRILIRPSQVMLTVKFNFK